MFRIQKSFKHGVVHAKYLVWYFLTNDLFEFYNSSTFEKKCLEWPFSY